MRSKPLVFVFCLLFDLALSVKAADVVVLTIGIGTFFLVPLLMSFYRSEGAFNLIPPFFSLSLSSLFFNL